MPAGHDFNALLIGALYGELSAVEESRLHAHLAAHPGDHEILRELTRTREAIRASAALAIVEPPQAISARLLQEAARRVRGRTAEVNAVAPASRWMRWLSSLMAHPGLAAAAMAVLVIGVFGTMFLNDRHQVAESLLSSSDSDRAAPAAPAPSVSPAASPAVPPAEGIAAGSGGQALRGYADEPGRGNLAVAQTPGDQEAAQPSPDDQAAAEPAVAARPAAPSPEPMAPGSTGDAGSTVGADRGKKSGELALDRSRPQDSYSVGLDELGAASPASSRDLKNRPAERDADRMDPAAAPPPPPANASSPPARRAIRPGYIEAKPVPSEEIALKDFDDEEKLRKPADRSEDREEQEPRAERGQREKNRLDVSKADEAERVLRRAPAPAPAEPVKPVGKAAVTESVESPDQGDAGDDVMMRQGPLKKQKQESAVAKKGAVSSADARAPSSAPDRTVRLAPPASAPASRTSDKASTGMTRGAGGDSPANAVSGAGAAAQQPPASPAPSSPADLVVTGSAAPTTAATTISVVDDKWAKSEHVRLVRLVRGNKCTEAASVARALSERAPRYYQDQVAGDRSLRVCESAIRDQLNLSEQAKRKRNRAEPARAADEATQRK